MHDIDPSITQVINDKLQELYSWSCSLDSPDIPLPKFSVPPHEIFQFNYQEGIVSFQLGQYLTIRTNGPKAHPLNKSILPLPLTRNNFGCNVFDPQYVTDLFCDYCQAGMHVLDIGSGAGANAFAALKKGAKVTAIDLSADNLELLWGSIILEYRQNLWLTVNPFPEKTTFFENSFNAILMSHVAHYLTGAQLRLGIEKIYKWLNLEEFFFFQALTPYSNPYLWNAFHMDVVAKYGQEWPGYFRDEKKELMHRHNLTVEPHIPGCMPNFGHPIHPYIIERELKRVGFEIVYLNYGSFSPLLSQKYPVTYQEIEAYVKGSMNSADQLNLESNLQVTYPELLCILKQDQIKYQELIKNQRNNNKPHQGWTWENISPSYRGASLQSMENVIAVAIKRERRQ